MTLSFPCDLAAVREAARQLRAFLQDQGVSPQELDAWELIFSEACNNAVEHTPVEHANTPVESTVVVTHSTVELQVRDRTPGFDLPEESPLPDFEEEGGRGLFLMRSLSDQFRYLRGRDQNCLIVRKGRSETADGRETQCDSLQVAIMESTLHTLTEELAASYESLSAIFRFTAELNRGGAGVEFVERWLRELLMVATADWFVLRLTNENATMLRVEGVSRGDVRLDPLDLREGFRLESSVELQAAIGRQDIWFDAAHPPVVGDPVALFGNSLAGFTHPIYVNEELVGVLAIGRYASHQSFTAGQVNIIHTFADFLGIQIRNARIQEGYLRSRLVTRELEIAASIQRSLLPERLPEPPGFRLAGYSESANKVGGDFYDVIEIANQDHRGLLLVIADVMGKGVPAAMFAAIFRSHLHALISLAALPGKLMAWLNQALYPDLTRVDMFVTAQLIFLDRLAGEIRIASAGHCPLLIADNESGIVEVSPDGMPLGINLQMEFEELCLPLPETLRLAMLTDGLIEARSPSGELLGMERVKQWMAESIRNREPVADACKSLVDLARGFQEDAPAADDLTLLLLTRQPEQI